MLRWCVVLGPSFIVAGCDSAGSSSGGISGSSGRGGSTGGTTGGTTATSGFGGTVGPTGGTAATGGSGGTVDATGGPAGTRGSGGTSGAASVCHADCECGGNYRCNLGTCEHWVGGTNTGNVLCEGNCTCPTGSRCVLSFIGPSTGACCRAPDGGYAKILSQPRCPCASEGYCDPNCSGPVICSVDGGTVGQSGSGGHP